MHWRIKVVPFQRMALLFFLSFFLPKNYNVSYKCCLGHFSATAYSIFMKLWNLIGIDLNLLGIVFHWWRLNCFWDRYRRFYDLLGYFVGGTPLLLHVMLKFSWLVDKRLKFCMKLLNQFYLEKRRSSPGPDKRELKKSWIFVVFSVYLFFEKYFVKTYNVKK